MNIQNILKTSHKLGGCYKVQKKQKTKLAFPRNPTFWRYFYQWKFLLKTFLEKRPPAEHSAG